METIYFQPPGINPKYCEIGVVSETDPEHIWYLEEPAKIPIKSVKIIDSKDVFYDKKTGLHIIKKL